jgi:hypothetical protein
MRALSFEGWSSVGAGPFVAAKRRQGRRALTLGASPRSQRTAEMECRWGGAAGGVSVALRGDSVTWGHARMSNKCARARPSSEGAK